MKDSRAVKSKLSNDLSEENDIYSDVNIAPPIENELSKPDRNESASRGKAAPEKLGMKCMIDINSTVKMSLLINDEKKIDIETAAGEPAGDTQAAENRSGEKFNNCESAARVRKSLENISIPSWYSKYSSNNIFDKSQKWRRQKHEVSITQVQMMHN